MTICCRDYDIKGICTLVDNGKRVIAVDIDGKLFIVLKTDVVVISPN